MHTSKAAPMLDIEATQLNKFNIYQFLNNCFNLFSIKLFVVLVMNT